MKVEKVLSEPSNKALPMAVSPSEATLLKLLRAKRYSRIEIKMNGSEIDSLTSLRIFHLPERGLKR